MVSKKLQRDWVKPLQERLASEDNPPMLGDIAANSFQTRPANAEVRTESVDSEVNSMPVESLEPFGSDDRDDGDGRLRHQEAFREKDALIAEGWALDRIETTVNEVHHFVFRLVEWMYDCKISELEMRLRGSRPSSWCKFQDGHCGSSVRRPALTG